MADPLAADALVSCLMVTLPVPHRLPYFRRSVADYCRQTHARRELVVVMDQGDPAAKAALSAHIASLGRDDIRIVDVPVKRTLGALRNLSFANARGELVCQWDDDDRYHPERIATQVSIMRERGAAALCLEDVFQYFVATRALHHISFRTTGEQAFPGSLMLRRDIVPRYPEDGPTAIRGEDTAGLRQLRNRGLLGVVRGVPHLYVYVVHGANTWNDEHLRHIAAQHSTSRTLLRHREADLRAKLDAYDFGPDDVKVCGYNGVAFTLGAHSGARTG